METNFVEQLASMQLSARQVEQELEEAKTVIDKLKNQIRVTQIQMIDKTQQQIRQLEFDTLRNETESAKLRHRRQLLSKEIDLLLEYRDHKLKKTFVQEKQINHESAFSSPSSSSSFSPRSMCQHLVDCFNYVAPHDDENLDENDGVNRTNPMLITVKDLEKSWKRKR